jgi:hypothetical protein
MPLINAYPRDWRAWEELYDSWIRTDTNIRLDREKLRALYEWFMRATEGKDVVVDMNILLDPYLTYEESKTLITSAIAQPLTEEEKAEIVKQRILRRMKSAQKEVQDFKEE